MESPPALPRTFRKSKPQDGPLVWKFVGVQVVILTSIFVRRWSNYWWGAVFFLPSAFIIVIMCAEALDCRCSLWPLGQYGNDSYGDRTDAVGRKSNAQDAESLAWKCVGLQVVILATATAWCHGWNSWWWWAVCIVVGQLPLGPFVVRQLPARGRTSGRTIGARKQKKTKKRRS